MASERSENRSWEPLRITYVRPTFSNQERTIAGRQDAWHKFIIYNRGDFKKHDVLKSIITTCEPEVLLPVMYKEEDGVRSSFLARNCSGAVENLVKLGLVVSLPGGHDVQIDIVLGFLSVQDLRINPNKTITHALYLRYESAKRVLNLDNFENERSLGSIFCPISIPKIFQFVLQCTKMGVIGNSRESRLLVRELSLKYNKLTAIILFEKFFNYHITKLDLRHNQILDVEYLRYFSDHKISELWLDGNPLCTKYNNSKDYIEAVKQVFPYLQKLDGIVLGTNERNVVPCIQTNFLGTGSKICLVKQFVKHFFTLYDQDDRIIMNGLYDRHAFYSMSLGTVSNAHKQVIKAFSTQNRNLLKFADYARCHEFLLQGLERIIAALRRQPPTIHNFKTFHIDILHEGDNHVAFSVQGLFYYRETTCPPLLFNRSFIITRKEDEEYCINNDQYYINETPISNNPISNYELKIDVKTPPKFVPTVFSSSEKEQLLTFLHELTTMNRKFCRMYLENSKWDIRGAITNFMQKYTVNDVPPEAFQ